MKKFLDKLDREQGNIRFYSYFDDSNFVFDNPKEPFERGLIDRKRLGLFFWERGGKQFVNYCIQLNKEFGIKIVEIKDLIIKAHKKEQFNYIFTKGDLVSQDFLDCLACLGEKKVKELIEGLS